MTNWSRLLYPNLGLTATWSQTTGGTATGYALTYLNNSKRGLPWRSTTANTNQVIVGTLAAASTVKAIALVNYLGLAGGTIKAETKNGGGAYSNFGGGTGLFTVPASNRTRLIVLYDPTGVTATDVRISFIQPGSPVTAYVELGVAFISTYLEPTQNVSPDVSMDQIDRSDQFVTESLGGQESIWQQNTYSQVGVTYRPLDPADLDALRVAFDAVGRHTPIVFAIDASLLDYTYYGTLPGRLAVSHEPRSVDQWQVRVQLKEAC